MATTIEVRPGQRDVLVSRHRASNIYVGDDVEPISPQSQYDAVVVNASLLAMAKMSSVAAARHLAALGTPVPESTLRTWRLQYPRRFAAIAKKHAPEIEDAFVSLAKDAALNDLLGASEATALERERIASGDVKDAASSAQKLKTAMAISVDKILLLEGRPTHITEHKQDAAESLHDLQSRFPGLFTDTTAEESDADQDIQDAEVIEDQEAKPRQEA